MKVDGRKLQNLMIDATLERLTQTHSLRVAAERSALKWAD